jgi:transposase-like protein
MGRKIRRHGADFTFRVVVESVQKNEVAEVARRYSVHPNQLTKWRQEFMERGAAVFEQQEGKEVAAFRKRVAQLEGLIGRKEVELSVLKNYFDFCAPPDGRS